MKAKWLAMVFLLIFVPAAQIVAQESSPYVMGEWFLGDSFQDGTTAVNIADTQFTFLNPTNQTLVLEYAFFDVDGGFCGCDRDVLKANGKTRYTMSAEAAGGQFTCTSANNNLQTEGTMKAIVFQSARRGLITISKSEQIGYQTHFFQNGPPTEAPLKGIFLTNTILDEIRSIHQKCVDFCNSHPGLCEVIP